MGAGLARRGVRGRGWGCLLSLAWVLSGCGAETEVERADRGVGPVSDPGLDQGPDQGLDQGPEVGPDQGRDPGPEVGPGADAEPGPDALPPDASPPDPEACNGARHLCDRPLPEVSFAMTHNAHAVEPPFNRVAANQTLDLAGQLAAGVRGLGIKLYVTDDAACGPLGLYGYHGFARFGCVSFASIAAPVSAFLAAHPREVLVVTIEGDADAAAVRAGLAGSGLDRWRYVHPPGAAWPTLGALVAADQRLVVFKSGDADAAAGLHPMWDLLQDTDYDFQNTSDFTCDRLRGPAEAPLFLLNHFLTRISPVASEAATTNSAAVLGARVLACAETRGLPTLVYVDFVQVGDTLAVVDQLNSPGDAAARRAALAAWLE